MRDAQTYEGRVTAFITRGGWGYIVTEKGHRWFFHIAQYSGKTEPVVGQRVSFQANPIRTGRTPAAINVKEVAAQ